MRAAPTALWLRDIGAATTVHWLRDIGSAPISPLAKGHGCCPLAKGHGCPRSPWLKEHDDDDVVLPPQPCG
jgi:hypothetical protein